MIAILRTFDECGKILNQQEMECYYADDEDGKNLCIAFGENSEIIIPTDELLKGIK